MRPRLACPLLLLAASACLAAAAAPNARLEVVPNFNAASVYVLTDGDFGEAAAKMEYRAGDAKEFRPGHPLSRTGKGRFAGSIFGLKADEPLEVRVTLAGAGGPDAGAGSRPPLLVKTRTRSEKFPTGGGKTCYISPKGDDAGPGTREKPFKTIQHAADLAGPGDTINLMEGSFFESVTVKRSGRPDAYILLRPDPKETAPPREIRLPDGSVISKSFLPRPEMIGWAAPRSAPKPLGGRLFVTDEARPVGAVALNFRTSDQVRPLVGRRAYHHASIEELQAAAPPLVPGWWQDPKAGKVYLRMADDRVPQTDEVEFGVLPFGLRFEGAGYWIVEDLWFKLFGGGPYGRGIDVVGSRNVIVRHCFFHTMRTGVAVRKAGSMECLIADSTFEDTGIWDWPWKTVKSHDTEGSGVDLAGGGGNVVRFCTFRGFFNGVGASTWGDLENETLNRDLDIHDNTFLEIGDDPLEPEGACMNVRFWNNSTLNTLQGISLAPITVGPVYVVRDRYVNYKASAVKVSVNSRGVVYLYHLLGWTNRPEGNAMDVSGPWDNMHFRNSILRGTRYVIEDMRPHAIGCTFDYCDLFTTAGERFVKWADRRYATLKECPAPTFGPHNLSVEPYAQVKDGQPAGLAPQLIDAGVVIPGINDDYKGKAPDVGPEEIK